MKITLKVAEVTSFQTQFLAMVSTGHGKDPVLEAVDKASGGALKDLMKLQGFSAQKGHKLDITATPKLKPKRVLLVGMTSDKNTSVSFRLRSLAYHICAAAKSAKARDMAVVVPKIQRMELRDIVRLLAEGLALGEYTYSLKTKEKEEKKILRKCTLIIAANGSRMPPSITKELRDALHLAEVTSSSVMLTRDLVNTPSNIMTPETFAKQARKVARSKGVKIKVLGRKKIDQEGMRMLMAVGAGSIHEPHFIHMNYTPKTKTAGRICLVGKGITFDSGGLSLKPPASQPDMKSDMAGAATVLGVMDAASTIGVPWEIDGIMPLCENMPDGSSYRPGDILESRSGKTVEITNTDAEGRLILADALDYASELRPDLIIDLATLTGACVVALGPYTAGMFSNNEPLARALVKAGEKAGEDLWRLPLIKALRKQLDSPVADMKNTGTRWGGAITAALFLKEFVGEHIWAHLDIAGPAFLNEKYGFSPKGASGFGVLTLLEFLRITHSFK